MFHKLPTKMWILLITLWIYPQKQPVIHGVFKKIVDNVHNFYAHSFCETTETHIK